MNTKTEIRIDQAKEMINSEWERRMSLVNDIKFRETCVKAAKELGITATEWKENKALILMMFANKVCSVQNELERPLELKF